MRRNLKHKVHRDSTKSWFYRHFVEKTINDNFFTATEIMNEKSNKELIKKIDEEIKINDQ